MEILLLIVACHAAIRVFTCVYLCLPILYIHYIIYIYDHFYFPAQLVGFTLSDLLDKPWSQVSSLLPPGARLQFLSRVGFSIPLLVDFHRMLQTPALGLSASHFFNARKNPYEYVHSMTIELAKLILAGTGITYQAVSYTHLRAHETDSYLVCRLLLEKKRTGYTRFWLLPILIPGSRSRIYMINFTFQLNS